MYRRDFITAAAGTMATGAFGWTLPGIGVGGGVAGPDPMDAAAFHASRKFAPTASGQIAYVERGRGPAALFLHALPLNGFQWRGALERLATHRRCVAPDVMGLGYSRIPEGQELNPEAQVRMLAEFLDALEIPRVDLVANDSGGMIAQLLVARHPDRVRTILLTNCDVHEYSPPPVLLPLVAAARAGAFADEVLAPQLTDRSRVHSATGLGECCYADPAHPTQEALEVYLAPLLSSPLRKAQFHRYFATFDQNPLPAIESSLKRCRSPLRVVWGMADTIFDPDSADWLDRTFPESRGVRRIEEAKLFFPEVLPDVIAEEARNLWLEA